MANNINIPATEDTPYINFDGDKGHLEISGKALPEDSLSFFKPVYEWLQEYFKSPAQSTELHLNLHYINSSSTRHLFNIITSLEELLQNKKAVKVVWHCKANDEMMKTKGEELQSIIDDIPFEIKEG